MVMTDRIQAIFQDARELQADALEMLAQGRVRNAAEKAWGQRVTDALILARTGEEPERAPETVAGFRIVTSLEEAVRRPRLLRPYYSREVMHGERFHNGLCDSWRARSAGPGDGQLC